jgi:hypothetical protein
MDFVVPALTNTISAMPLSWFLKEIYYILIYFFFIFKLTL